MKLVKTIPPIAGLAELFVFYCSHCKKAETKVAGAKRRVGPLSQLQRRHCFTHGRLRLPPSSVPPACLGARPYDCAIVGL
jgi:hypothetical protein